MQRGKPTGLVLQTSPGREMAQVKLRARAMPGVTQVMTGMTRASWKAKGLEREPE